MASRRGNFANSSRSPPLVRESTPVRSGIRSRLSGFTPALTRRKKTAIIRRRCCSTRVRPGWWISASCQRARRYCAIPVPSLPSENSMIYSAKMSAASWSNCSRRYPSTASIFTIHFSVAACLAKAGTTRRSRAMPVGTIFSSCLAGWRRKAGRCYSTPV